MTKNKLLLLSNDHWLIFTIQRWIRVKDRFTFQPVTDVADLFPHLSQTDTSLLLLDKDIAPTRWPDIITTIHQENPDILILFVAADATPNELRQAMMLGVVDYLEKPFTKEEIFLEALTRAWERITSCLTDPQYAAEPPRVYEEEMKQTAPVLPVLLRLDTAVPATVLVNHAFELAVSIRHPTSPILQQPDLTVTAQGDLQVEWPNVHSYIRLRLQVSAPDCEIHDQIQHAFKLYREKDSPVFYYHLTPQKTGTISIIVTVYQADDWMGSARLRTEATETAVGHVETQVTSQALTSRYLTRLMSNLVNHFNLEELRTLCLTIGIRHEEFPITLTPFARELVTYCDRHLLTDKLLRACKQARPDVLWPNRIPAH